MCIFALELTNPLDPLQHAHDEEALDRVDDDGIDQDFGDFEGFVQESREVGSGARREDVNGTIVDFGGEDATDAESSARNGLGAKSSSKISVE
jgi:hypothetical protein